MVDLSRDVALLHALDDVSDAYDAAVRAAQNAWTSTYQNLRDAYDATVDAAWNDYSCEYSRNAAEFTAIQAQTWENSAEYQAIQTTYQREFAAINARNASQSAEINAWYSLKSTAIYNDYLARRYAAHGTGCSGSYHSNDCQRRQLQEEEIYRKNLLDLNALLAQKELALNAETQISTLQSQARRDSKLADAKKTFETDRNDRLAELATDAAERGKAYEIAVANAIYDFYAGGSSGGLAGADETYQNAIATAAQTATTAAWNAVRSAVTAWKNDASTPSDWGNYVDALYALSQTQALADSGAYVAQVQASASAQKTADVAAVNAYRNYLTSNATSTCVAECGNISSVQTLQNAVETATATNETSTIELYSTELVAQIETSLSTRLARIPEYQNLATTGYSEWYGCYIALVGVTDANVRLATEQTMNAALNSMWFADASTVLTNETTLYAALIDSGAAIESGTLELNRELQTELWSELGTYWKAEIATATDKTISTESAENDYSTALEAAEKTLTLAQLAAESTAATAQIASEQNRLNAEKTLTQTTSQTIFDAYFTSLISACGEMANDFVGDYYASAVSAIQTAFNAQNASASNLETSLISKAAASATAALGLDSAYANSAINALYDYFATQNNSNAAALNRTKTSDQAEIDARVAYYCAVENANCAKDVAVVEANADATRRQLVFTQAWGEYQLATAWTSGDPTYYPMNYSGLPGVPRTLPGGLTSATSALGSDSNAILSRLSLMQLPSPYGSFDYWTLFRDMNSTIVSMQTKNAQLQCEAATANAANAYVTAFANNYEAETRAALNSAGTDLASDLSAETALNNALWTAQGTAYSGCLTAIRNSDSTSNVLNYVNANVASSIAYASSLANAYGDFQIANRQNKLNGTTLSNPRREAYADDVTWAQQTKSLRNQYYAKSGTAASGYYATVTNALATYDAAALNAELTAAQDYFNAKKTFSQNAQTAYNDYVLADFNAAKAQTLAYLTASITQLTADYAKETELAESRADVYAELLDDLLADLAAADLTKFGTISTLKENFAEALSNANAADATIAAVNEAELASEKTENEAAYNDATAEADATYQKAQQGVWNDAFLETLGETATEKTAFDAITAAMKTALETAGNAYRDSTFAAYDDFSGEMFDLAKIYEYNQERINNGGTVLGNAFENPTFDYEVCFVAGTQVLMADGSTKPIEQIRPGDQVLAAHHLNPEEKPTAANVVRFFDNGEKEVVKLLFNNQTAQSSADATQEIVCTPSHRFYVIGKGWIHAQGLQQGDLCLSATGEKIAFLQEKTVRKNNVFSTLKFKKIIPIILVKIFSYSYITNAHIAVILVFSVLDTFGDGNRRRQANNNRMVLSEE